jgi:hypothetical protein
LLLAHAVTNRINTSAHKGLNRFIYLHLDMD